MDLYLALWYCPCFIRAIQVWESVGSTCSFLSLSLSQAVLDCCEGSSQREAIENLLKKLEEEKTLKAESLVKLLGAVKASFPGLHLLLDSLVVAANVSDDKGMMGALPSDIWDLGWGNCQKVWLLVWTCVCSFNFLPGNGMAILCRQNSDLEHWGEITMPERGLLLCNEMSSVRQKPVAVFPWVWHWN